MRDSLVARILVKILKEKLSKLMGPKSWKEDGLGTFGIKAKRNVEEALRNLPVVKKFRTAAMKSWLTISQQEVKKLLENSSLPGELALPREKTACLISRVSGMANNLLFGEAKLSGGCTRKGDQQQKFEGLGKRQ